MPIQTRQNEVLVAQKEEALLDNKNNILVKPYSDALHRNSTPNTTTTSIEQQLPSSANNNNHTNTQKEETLESLTSRLHTSEQYPINHSKEEESDFGFEKINTSSLSESSFEKPVFAQKNLSLPTQNPSIWKQDPKNQQWFDLVEATRSQLFDTDYREIKQMMTDESLTVKKISTYTPAQISSNKIIVVPFVHGTFNNGDEYSNDETEIRKAVKKYVKEQADKQKAPALLMIMQWSGHNDSGKRKTAGQYLAQILDDYFSNHYVHTIVHSHGGQVLSHASKFLKHSIDKATYIAVPIRYQEDQFSPENIKELNAYYSDTDTVQTLGSISWPYGQSSPKTWRKFVKEDLQLNKDAPVRNIKVLLDGKSPGHSSIKQMLWRLTDIENKFKDFQHPNFVDFIVSVQLNKEQRSKNVPTVLMALRGDSLQDIMQTQTGHEQRQLARGLLASKASEDLFKQAYGHEFHNVYNAPVQRVFEGTFVNNNAAQLNDSLLD